MKWILVFGMLLSAQVGHADSVVYQSAPYGSTQAFGAVCSSASCLDPTQWDDPSQYIGETFSLTSAATIKTIDFYKGLFSTDPISEPVDIPSDITVAFYDASSYSLVYSQTFNTSEYTQTERFLGPGTGQNYNIHAAFTPFDLGAGDYIVYYFGDHLGLPLYAGYGDTVVVVSPSQGGYTFDNPYYAFGATAVKLSGSFLTTVPEPESFVLMLAGFGLIVLTQKRKQRTL